MQEKQDECPRCGNPDWDYDMQQCMVCHHAEYNPEFPIEKQGSVWMVKGRVCQSAARELVERCMISLGKDTADFKARDNAIHAICPTLNGMLNYVSKPTE